MDVRRMLPAAALALVLLPALAALADPTPTPATTTDCGQVQGATPTPLPRGVVCNAGGLNPGTPQLPRTGPAPVVPTAVVGIGLLLIGAAAVAAGHRRTA